MDVEHTSIPGVLIVRPERHIDARGWFQENVRLAQLSEYAEQDIVLVQTNTSYSQHGVLRGLHAQRSQGKLISAVQGCVFDVALDIRPQSPAFGHYFSMRLKAEDGLLLWLPPGIAHGFLTLTSSALMHYSVTTEYQPDDEIAVAWNDPSLNIAWPLHELHKAALISQKDQNGSSWDALRLQL